MGAPVKLPSIVKCHHVVYPVEMQCYVDTREKCKNSTTKQPVAQRHKACYECVVLPVETTNGIDAAGRSRYGGMAEHLLAQSTIEQAPTSRREQQPSSAWQILYRRETPYVRIVEYSLRAPARDLRMYEAQMKPPLRN